MNRQSPLHVSFIDVHHVKGQIDIMFYSVILLLVIIQAAVGGDHPVTKEYLGKVKTSIDGLKGFNADTTFDLCNKVWESIFVIDELRGFALDNTKKLLILVGECYVTDNPYTKLTNDFKKDWGSVTKEA